MQYNPNFSHIRLDNSILNKKLDLSILRYMYCPDINVDYNEIINICNYFEISKVIFATKCIKEIKEIEAILKLKKIKFIKGLIYKTTFQNIICSKNNADPIFKELNRNSIYFNIYSFNISTLSKRALQFIFISADSVFTYKLLIKITNAPNLLYLNNIDYSNENNEINTLIYEWTNFVNKYPNYVLINKNSALWKGFSIFDNYILNGSSLLCTKV